MNTHLKSLCVCVCVKRRWDEKPVGDIECLVLAISRNLSLLNISLFQQYYRPSIRLFPYEILNKRNLQNFTVAPPYPTLPTLD
jgi:hypothetical protein